eukprot:jgi/Tetstr1/458233/TSEL_044721.t1
MGVGEDPVGEDGVDIDAPAWPPADVEAADEGVIRKGDPGDFYMKVIAKKFRGVWHYGVITGVVTEWVLEDYGGATQWRAVFEDGDIVDLLRSEVSGPGLRAGGTTQLRLYGITRTRRTHPSAWQVVEAMAAAQEHPPVDADGDARLGHIGFRAMKQEDRRQALVPIPSNFGRGSRPSFAVSKKSKGSSKVTVQSGWVMEDCMHHMETFSILNAGPLFEEARTQRGAKAQRPGRRGAKARRPRQRGAKARRPRQRGAKARRPGQRGAKARRPGQRGAKARRPGQRGAKARRPGQRGAKARRPGQRGAKARRPGQRGAKASGMGGAAVATE